jgi:hypothetical protein
MEELNLEETHCTPKINLDWKNGILRFHGRFIPFDGYYFYSPIIDWIKEYAKNPQRTTVVKIFIDTISTSSAKSMMLILRSLSKIQQEGNSVSVEWYYDDGDELVDWKHYISSFDFPVKYIEVENELVY